MSETVEYEYSYRVFNNGSGEVVELLKNGESVMNIGVYGLGMSREDVERILPVADLFVRIAEDYESWKRSVEKGWEWKVQKARDEGVRSMGALKDLTIEALEDENYALQESNAILRARLERYESDSVEKIDELVEEIELEFKYGRRLSRVIRGLVYFFNPGRKG